VQSSSRVFISADPSFGLGTVAVLLLALSFIVWFIVSNVVAHKGGDTEIPNRMAQMYGYTICLVAVILMLTSATSIVSAAFDRANPLQTEYEFGPSLASFEAYRATLDKERGMMGPGAVAIDTASEATLKRRYTGLAEARRAATLHRTTKSFVTNGLLAAIALALFIVHWGWLGRMSVRTRSA
jgi:hypothetical protein